jgi:hypothetical protein
VVKEISATGGKANGFATDFGIKVFAPAQVADVDARKATAAPGDLGQI